MKALTRWDSFKELENLQSHCAKLFALMSTPIERPGLELMTAMYWSPFADLIEHDTEWLVQADLPEVRKNSLKGAPENGVLCVTGEPKHRKEGTQTQPQQSPFVRRLTLPAEARNAKVRAEFKGGVLK